MLSDRESQHAEAVEAGLDRFIEQRSRSHGAEKANAREWMLREAENERRRDRQALHAELWVRHYERQAAVHEDLARRNRERAAELGSSSAGGDGT
jgi:hypothetical protein